MPRFGLLSVSLPWLFGPYAQQMSILAQGLLMHNHTVYWITLPNAVPPEHSGRALTYLELVQLCDLPSAPKPGSAEADLSDRIKFLALGSNLPRNTFTMSSINRLLRMHRIHALASLMDLDKLVVDDLGWATQQSVSWYPNHFDALDADFRSKLEMFTDVASLSPSDALMLSAALPRQRVTWIPHAIMVDGTPESRKDGGDAARRIRSTLGPAACGPQSAERGGAITARDALRVKWSVPLDAVVVLVNCANYEPINRKNLDVSLVAFKRLRESEPRAFLYLHVIDVLEVLKGERKGISEASLGGQTLGIRLDLLLDRLQLPEGSYLLDSSLHQYEDSLELTCLADVLLHPSKAEGFGMPVLEAQALGVPVITTQFGAMSDYTRFGFSVAAQPVWMVRGFARLPILSEVVTALKAAGTRTLPEENRTTAAAWIRENMSPHVVVNRFLQVLSQTTALVHDDHNAGEPGDADALASANEAAAGNAAALPMFAPPFAYDELLYEEGSEALADYVANRKRRATVLPGVSGGGDSDDIAPHSWLLIRSQQFEVRWSLPLVTLMGQIDQLPPGSVNVVILQTRRADGSVFPLSSDLNAGRIDSRLTFFVRSKYARAHLKRAATPTGRSGTLEAVSLNLLASAPAASVKLNEGSVDAGPANPSADEGTIQVAMNFERTLPY